MHQVFGISESDIVVNKDKLIRLMQQMPADFPSEKNSVYDEYIAECSKRSELIPSEDWIKTYTFWCNAKESRGICALIYKDIRLNVPKVMVSCMAGKDGKTYIGLPLYEPWIISNNMTTYMPLTELKETLEKYIKKVSDGNPYVRLMKFE